MSVRLRRLAADYDKVRACFDKDSRIRLLETIGDPPERYQFEYLVTGLQENLVTGELKRSNIFIVEIHLPGSYPRMAPQCKMKTPSFHPNIAPHAICIGDHWAAGESLADLIIRIAEMISFQSYNLKSPLNGKAAEWVEHNRDKIPLDKFDFASLLAKEPDITQNVSTRYVCSNCNASIPENEVTICVNGHVTCKNCRISCGQCGAALCASCDFLRCGICGEILCSKCASVCSECGAVACSKHSTKCQVCGKLFCVNCLVRCAKCKKIICLEHIHQVEFGGKRIILCNTCTL
ncbi:hypothetical protein JW926_07800 [Candidatus Sumerlaeota bacterium]|nr:hypothetical protein [Candidatus Sumerlaeota bacterium]